MRLRPWLACHGAAWRYSLAMCRGGRGLRFRGSALQPILLSAHAPLPWWYALYRHVSGWRSLGHGCEGGWVGGAPPAPAQASAASHLHCCLAACVRIPNRPCLADEWLLIAWSQGTLVRGGWHWRQPALVPWLPLDSSTSAPLPSVRRPACMSCSAWPLSGGAGACILSVHIASLRSVPKPWFRCSHLS